jgi:hypothetical protein
VPEPTLRQLADLRGADGKDVRGRADLGRLPQDQMERLSIIMAVILVAIGNFASAVLAAVLVMALGGAIGDRRAIGAVRLRAVEARSRTQSCLRPSSGCTRMRHSRPARAPPSERLGSGQLSLQIFLACRPGSQHLSVARSRFRVQIRNQRPW